jgi:hypothetical protein
MPYIGQSPASKLLTASDITDGVISTAKLADSSVSTAKLADDSVGNTKLDLSADYAFTGTVSGAGGLVKLFSQTDVSASSAYDIDSTYINSTYDDYQFYIEGTVSSNGQYLGLRFFTSGSVVSANYGYTNARLDENAYYIDAEDASEIRLYGGTVTSTGNFSVEGTIRSVNSTTIPTSCFHKARRQYQTDDRGESGVGGQDGTTKGTTVNGLRFFNQNGNVTVARFTLFGIVK